MNNTDQMTIKKRYDEIKELTDILRKQLIKLQCECSHPGIVQKYCSNTGNYDPFNDSYWISYYCLDCGKNWKTIQ